MKSKFYVDMEFFACQILQELGLGKFHLAEHTEDYDVISETGKKYEVKFTNSKKTFDSNNYRYHTPGQKKQNLVIFYMDSSKLIDGRISLEVKILGRDIKDGSLFPILIPLRMEVCFLY